MKKWLARGRKGCTCDQAGDTQRFRELVKNGNLAELDGQFPLWERLAKFQFSDPDAEISYASKLVEQQGWTAEFAARVIEEYRRFLYLCMVAGHKVVPSHTVDEAWHLHLQYTRSYWEELCLYTLGRVIHHDPSPGGEGAKPLEGMYDKTLESYVHFFGDYPDDIWGHDNGNNVKRLRDSSASAGKLLSADGHKKGDPVSLTQVLAKE
jgi:hypothetical protein